MTRILIFAPNAGASLSSGGGTNLLLKQARVLARLGNEVVLAGFHSWSLRELAERNRIDLPPLRIETAAQGTSALSLFKMIPVKLSAYSALLHPAFAPWVRRVMRTVAPQVVWFHDDIPRCAEPYLNDCMVRLYVHYPLVARKLEITPPLRQSAGAAERWNDWVMRLCHVVSDPRTLRLNCLHVNSSVTQRAVKRAWGLEARVVHSYVEERTRAARSRPTFIALGTISTGKNYLGLLATWNEAKRNADIPTEADLRIIGYSRDQRYLSHLRRRILQLGIQNSCSVTVDLDSAQVEGELSRATAIIHPAVFEPFGLALLEGMAHGLIPLVYQGEWAGGWTDIIDRGKWGLGFGIDQSFSTAARRALHEQETLSAASLLRSKYFSEDRFATVYAE